MNEQLYSGCVVAVKKPISRDPEASIHTNGFVALARSQSEAEGLAIEWARNKHAKRGKDFIIRFDWGYTFRASMFLFSDAMRELKRQRAAEGGGREGLGVGVEIDC
jgi:hypothetical protein